ncbi:MAG: nicotinamide riboside transporter PnuC [Paludibacteraceae bacterium]|jgi:nicotinamide mononucleotide transporter|nr:nicotinamide riboside transporter PnuC [Paludibacteraceae bacterium]
MSSINRTTWIFLILGLLVQVLTFVLMPDNPISLVSGMLGICSVVLGAQGNILTFVFGFAQVATYTYLCCVERFYAEIAINIYYFITMIYGVYCWRNRLSNNSLQVQTRRLSIKLLAWGMLLIALFSWLTGWLLERFTDDPQPYMDAFTTVPAIAAQLLMVLAYREQWYLWLVVDVLAVVMWLRAENYCMAAQYVFWCVNCIYGYIQWTRQLDNPTH